MTLAVDRDEIARFVRALFCNLDPDGYVSLRAFRQFPPKGERDRPLHIEAIRLNLGLEPIIDAAVRIATRICNGGEPAVFAPPICTFASRKGAKSRDVHEAPTLSVEIDAGDLEQIADRFTLIIGVRPRIALHSGSLWVDPATGEAAPKGHLHWKLARPARGPDSLRMLRRARDIATLIAGADPTGTPPVHPLRWPGTWNRKTEPAVMARIIEETTSTIDLAEALAALEDAAEASGVAVPKGAAHLITDDLPAELAQLADWLNHYTTAKLRPAKAGLRHDWNNVAMALHRATAGSEDGFKLFNAWSATAPQFYTQAGCRRRWDAITGCPPTWIGARWLRRMAIAHGWVLEPPKDWEAAHPTAGATAGAAAGGGNGSGPDQTPASHGPTPGAAASQTPPPTECGTNGGTGGGGRLPPPQGPDGGADGGPDDGAEGEDGPEEAEGEADGTEGDGEPKQDETPESEAKPGEAKSDGTDEDTKPKPLTEAERAALFEYAADLNDEDYELERDAIAEQLSCGRKTKFRLTALGKIRDRVRKARADAEAVAAAAAAAAAARKNQPPAPPPDDTPEVKALIAEFNAKYFVVDEDGKAIIYSPKHDPDQNRRFYERITTADLATFYLNRTVLTGFNEKTGEPIYKPVAYVWLHHTKRRQYIGGIVFDPSTRKHPVDVLNLWQSFSVKPKAGSWEALKHHVKTIICSNNTEHFEYLMDWMSDVMQRPEKQGEVAVVLRGGEGVGKGILARAMKYLLGQHSFAISNSKHLTGNFNAHLRGCVFLFADEALYAGDKAHVGILKSIITEPYLTVEGKFQNAAMAANRLHLMLASNEMWVVPASMESRRFYVLDVSDAHANDHDYFKAIQDELEHGGYEAMLHELLSRSITSNLRSPPVTAALITQRTLSLPVTEAWWLDCLMRGYVFRSELGLEDEFAKWLDPISTELLYASYLKFCTAQRERRPLNRIHFGRWLHETAGCKPFRPAAGTKVIVGEHITDATTTGSNYTSRVAEPVYRDRPACYSLGTLTDARDAFTTATKLVIEWPDDGPGTP